MNDRFFDQPILNSPYAWELNEQGQPSSQIPEWCRISKLKKRRQGQRELVKDEGKGLYDETPLVDDLLRFALPEGLVGNE